MNRESRMRWKMAGIVGGILLLVVLWECSGAGENKLQEEGKCAVTEKEAEYLVGILKETAVGKEQEKEIVQQAELLAKDRTQNRTIFLDTYMDLVERYGLGEYLYEKAVLPLAFENDRIQCNKESFRIAGAEDGFGEEQWKKMRYREVRAIIWNPQPETERTAESSEEQEEEACIAWEILKNDVVLENVWITDVKEHVLGCFWNNLAFQMEGDWKEAEREQIADLQFTDGQCSQVKMKRDKVAGKLLRIGEGELEIEGQGIFPVATGFQAYRLYDVLCSYEIREFPIGYEYADYVIEDGKICAALLRQKENMENIRVLLHTDDYTGIYHEQVIISCEGAFRVEWNNGRDQQSFSAGDRLELRKESPYFQEGDRVKVIPEAWTDRLKAESIVRSQGIPSYHGSLEVVLEEQGLYVVNEVLLEEYLCAVVPSEMPSGYPMEALKAQSICARTYAYQNLLHAGLPDYGAHVDDSTAYQVYNNISEQERSTRAVKETCGQILWNGEGPQMTYYYSTSCGYGTDEGIWGKSGTEVKLKARHIAPQEEEVQAVSTNDFSVWILGKGSMDYEREEPWYRWSYEVEKLDSRLLFTHLQERQKAAPGQILTLRDGTYQAGEIQELGKLLDIRIEKRGTGGVAEELVIEGEKQTVKVISEYNIRYVLCDGRTEVIRQDGSRQLLSNLLPSAFFIIEAGKEKGSVVGYRLIGGGYGHGVGMSQNGAANMAECGRKAEEILAFFFQGSQVKTVY